MTTPDLEAIAVRLTEAQRTALFYPGGYMDPNTSRALRRKGLMQGGLLTELGTALRAHIQKEQKV